MKKCIKTILLTSVLLASAGMAMAHEPSQSIAVYGDAPYGTTPTDTAEFQATPAFIQSINKDRDVSFVVHVGDIHSGKQYCTADYDRSIYGLWTQYQRPLYYTPGDNEWTDCHKAAEGGNVLDAGGNPVDFANGDPAANLDLIRSIFFRRPAMTLGKQVGVQSQGQHYFPSHSTDRKYVENRMWQKWGVQFVTLNIPGGSNNDQDVWYGAATETPAQTQERNERNQANLHWLDAAFARARESDAKAVVIVSQADMWDPEKGASHLTGFEPFIAELAAKSLQFHKPVLMFNGDSHVFRSENPLDPNAACTWEMATPCVPVANLHPGYNVPNFHRVVVHGSTFPLEWLKLSIDPRKNAPAGANAFGPFSWTRMPQP